MIGDGDLEAIFESGNFDTAAEFTSIGLTLRAIFNEPSSPTQVYGIQIEAVEPSIICLTSEVTSAVVPKIPVTVNGRTFTVERIEKSGVGMTTLYLKT